MEQKDLYEFQVVEEESDAQSFTNIIAFRKYGFKGIGNFNTFVSQFPFRGHEQLQIHDKPQDKMNVIIELQKNQASGEVLQDDADRKLRHEDITDEMILQNQFVFALSQAKIRDIQRENKENFGDENGQLRLQRNFDLFNRRTEFPYDTIENPMKLNPHSDERYDWVGFQNNNKSEINR